MLISAGPVVGAALAFTSYAAAAGLYPKGSAVLQVDADSWDRLIVKTHVPSVVEFYAPWCGHCKNLQPAYEKAAQSLKGIVNIAAVNCDEEKNKPLCGKQGVQGFPTLKTVRATGPGSKPAIVPYQGPREAKAIVDVAKALLPNHVKRVKDKDLAGWLADKNETAKAILFSDKGKTPAQLKAIANDFYGNLNVAQIRDDDQAAADTFGVTSYPTLVVLPGGDKEPVTYDGDLDKFSMAEFLKGYAAPRSDVSAAPKRTASKDSKAKNSKASKAYEQSASSHAKEEASEAPRSAASETIEDPDEASPQPTVDGVPKPVQVPTGPKPVSTLATPAELQSACLGAKTTTCLLAIVPDGGETETDASANHALINLATLQQKLQASEQHIFPFYVVPGANEQSKKLREALGLSGSGLELITVNGKKGWWRHYDAGKGFDVASVEDWVDAIKFGDIKKEKLPAELFGAEEAKDKDEL